MPWKNRILILSSISIKKYKLYEPTIIMHQILWIYLVYLGKQILNINIIIVNI